MGILGLLLSLSSLGVNALGSFSLLETPSTQVVARILHQTACLSPPRVPVFVGAGKDGKLLTCFMISIYQDANRNGRKDASESGNEGSMYAGAGVAVMRLAVELPDEAVTPGSLAYTVSVTAVGGAVEAASGTL